MASHRLGQHLTLCLFVDSSDIPFCENCEDVLAEWFCLDCDTFFCRECGSVLHKSAQRRAHKLELITGGSTDMFCLERGRETERGWGGMNDQRGRPHFKDDQEPSFGHSLLLGFHLCLRLGDATATAEASASGSSESPLPHPPTQDELKQIVCASSSQTLLAALPDEVEQGIAVAMDQELYEETVLDLMANTTSPSEQVDSVEPMPKNEATMILPVATLPVVQVEGLKLAPSIDDSVLTPVSACKEVLCVFHQLYQTLFSTSFSHPSSYLSVYSMHCSIRLCLYSSILSLFICPILRLSSTPLFSLLSPCLYFFVFLPSSTCLPIYLSLLSFLWHLLQCQTGGQLMWATGCGA